ncbi:TIGR03619 family F420-dependent LLM class oxidoreductase [Sphingobium tyrosinilyticum]|uniref:TIGR03619 family F420-dependent LLM class oxidoreductase n=1 Tax=Sphingobium tyrosinilyticum TaxID=2715436 RepID=A0ABV9F497_9SPHN
MKFGLSCSTVLGHSPAARDVIRLVQEAEAVGFHSILVGDHVLRPLAFDTSSYPAGIFDAEMPWYDPFVLLAAVAGVTQTIRLGTGVSVVPYRPPVLQAQAIATLDFMSEGRFFYGAGVGWMREEYEALGVPFAARGQRTDEYLEIIKSLLSGKSDGFHGSCIDFPGGHIHPLPVQKPHPPIIIGGETQAALRRIAKYGDGFHINWKTLAQLERLLGDLAVHMADNGRVVSSLYKQLAATDIALVRAAKNDLADYAALGVDEIIFSPKHDSPADGIEAVKRFADEFF